MYEQKELSENSKNELEKFNDLGELLMDKENKVDQKQNQIKEDEDEIKKV